MGEWRVPQELGGGRLDAVLARLADGLSRRAARRLIDQGSVFVDGRRVRTASRPVSAGSLVRLASTEALAPTPPGIVRVLWERDGILVLDKPAAVHLAPTREASSGCLLSALARERQLPLASLHAVHRLDTPTSGAVLIALDPGSAAFLSAAIREGRVRKTYLAWVSGIPDPSEGTWEWPLSKGSGGVVRVEEGGRPALSRYRLVVERAGISLLELEPLTGRTHQLRVHCARAGHPILGDRKYGTSHPGVKRGLLHAFRLTFPVPGGGEASVEAPLPEDMRLAGLPSAPGAVL